MHALFTVHFHAKFTSVHNKNLKKQHFTNRLLTTSRFLLMMIRSE